MLSDDVLARSRAPERRGLTRWIPAFPARAELDLGQASPLQAEVLNLSTGGALIRLQRAAQLDSSPEITLRVTLGTQTRALRARVVRHVTHSAPVAGQAEQQLLELGVQFGSQETPPSLDVRGLPIDPAVTLRVPAALALRRRCLPLSVIDGEVAVACADLDDTPMLRALERSFDLPIRLQLADAEALTQELRRHYAESLTVVERAEEDAVSTCHELLRAALLRRASDVHVDTEREGGRVRLRVDGQLEDLRTLPAAALPELFSRIKVLGGMDIAERRAPQDGRFTFQASRTQQIDIRVATLPTQYGERATLRLLASAAEAQDLDALGLTSGDRSLIGQAIRRPHGLLLATGPTGCGKTTTLSVALRDIVARRKVNAIAVQDPIEYDLPGVAQVEIDPGRKVTFASALRSILRHDPDVIFIGEIRDGETADIAVKAALTGHLVLASLHTNSAAGAVTRLLDMGVDPFLVSATVRLVVSQRLVRRLCPHCRAPRVLDGPSAALLGRKELTGSVVHEPRGCVHCAGRGYFGRTGLFELLPVDDPLARKIAARSDETTLAAESHGTGRPSIVDDAITKLREGRTSLDEILHAVAL